MKYSLGDTVEDFELPNHRGETRSLTEALQDGRVILVFFRGFW
ncbi:MAG: hypothetical protein ABEK50_12490 [bacterium]